ncbi:MAG: hypothetical protein HQK86_06685 [Nitrospinae bacterium]|nr:hypothetical protein [Nitrospinota bacterium]MBF0633146.1 hypothetical protein [Nitrospinota bacterium]
MLDDAVNVIEFTRIEKLLLKMYKGGGRPPIPPLMLFKALLLESWYGCRTWRKWPFFPIPEARGGGA